MTSVGKFWYQTKLYILLSIDDDEENALSNLRNVRNGSTDMQTPPVPTEDVISLLLQRQTPVLNKTDDKDSSEKE